MRLRQFANTIGISYSTALRMFRRDEIPGAYKLPSGTIVVPENAIDVLRHSVNDSNEASTVSLELIERASHEVLGMVGSNDLMSLIHQVLIEYTGGITHDGN